MIRDFLLFCLFALVGIAARLGYRLGGEPPPDDPASFAAWKRRQKWSAIGELCTVPAFGALWIGVAKHWQLPIELVIPGCMISGALGFGFCLSAVQRQIQRRVDNA